MSFGYEVSVMILLRMLIINKIITLTSHLKLTIKTNKPYYIYLRNSCNTVTPSAFGPNDRRALGMHIRQTTRACVITIKCFLLFMLFFYRRSTIFLDVMYGR